MMRCTVEGVASLGICLCHTSRYVKGAGGIYVWRIMK
jgi:hypothetical protein